MTAKKKRRRAVGPPGATPAVDEPLTGQDAPERFDRAQDERDTERFLADRPPHHEPR